MNDIVGLEECVRLCVSLQRQLEDDCIVPPDALGGEMRPAYEKVRENQLAAIKAIRYQLYELLDGRL